MGRGLSGFDEPSHRDLDCPVGAFLMERFRLLEHRDWIVSGLAAIADAERNVLQNDKFRLGDSNHLAVPNLAMDAATVAVIAGITARSVTLLGFHRP